MITDVSLRLLYLIFDRFLGWLRLLGRASSSKDIELLVLAAATRSQYSRLLRVRRAVSSCFDAGVAGGMPAQDRGRGDKRSPEPAAGR